MRRVPARGLFFGGGLFGGARHRSFQRRRYYSVSDDSNRNNNDTAVASVLGPEPLEREGGENLPALTKIVATVGPVSESKEMVQRLVHGGMHVMRINFSHATYEEAEMRINNLKQASGRHTAAMGSRSPNMRAVLLDTQGPEVRTGIFAEEKIPVEAGQTITLTSDETAKEASTLDNLYVNYPSLASTVERGNQILLDDGLISLHVLEVDGQAGRVVCECENAAMLGSRKGVTLPGITLTDLPALTDKDKKDIAWGMRHDVDFIALSFVRTGDDVATAKRFVENQHDAIHGAGAKHALPQLISKIENAASLENFESILEESDGIMVARGDLGVEIAYSKVSRAQKLIIKRCRDVGKPVIVATQMLESMSQNPRPTRAEVSDVTNAVYDGADCVMLSGETANGKYPAEALSAMWKVTQNNDRARQPLSAPPTTQMSSNAAVAEAAVSIAAGIYAKAIVVLTRSGTTARLVAKYRPKDAIVIAYCTDAKIARQLILFRGVHPIVDDQGEAEKLRKRYGVRGVKMLHESFETRPRSAVKLAQKLNLLNAGDKIVIISEDADSAEFAGVTGIRVGQCA